MEINNTEANKKSLNFIEAMVEQDLRDGRNDGRIQTRFPPEPNGYLHIGHAKAICMDFGIAKKYKGICNLRFDDTNPVKEDVEYVDSIQEDIQWLGYEWENIYYASDYFQQLWDLAEKLILDGKAYIDEQSAETIAKQKGTTTVAGTESPYRNRPAAESLALFRKMNTGEIPEGAMVLRAKINMASSNMHMRDPIMYRIITDHPHHRTGWTWKAYPMYDYAHGQSDYFEGVSHSLCTLEFEVHRPLYDWFIDQFQDSDYRPRQTEFNRLNITYTVMSKRKMLQLVEEGLVTGWDDPRMPTLCGLRRRGYTAEAIHNFIDKIGYTKYDGMIDMGVLEHAARETLNKSATRVNAVLNPVKLIVTNYPEGQTETLMTENNPEDESAGMREILFSRELYIERDDFMEDAPKKFFRIHPGLSAYPFKHFTLFPYDNSLLTLTGNVNHGIHINDFIFFFKCLHCYFHRIGNFFLICHQYFFPDDLFHKKTFTAVGQFVFAEKRRAFRKKFQNTIEQGTDVKMFQC